MRKILISIFFTALIFTSNQLLAEAKPVDKKSEVLINLYEQPQAQAKIAASVKPGQALIPFFHQNGWTKVADPSTGNVGWVEDKILTNSGYPQVYIKVQNQNDKNGQSYQILQYSGSNNINQQQMNTSLQNFEKEQAQWSQQFNRLMNQNMENFNQLMQQFQKNANDMQLMMTPTKPSK